MFKITKTITDKTIKISKKMNQEKDKLKNDPVICSCKKCKLCTETKILSHHDNVICWISSM